MPAENAREHLVVQIVTRDHLTAHRVLARDQPRAARRRRGRQQRRGVLADSPPDAPRPERRAEEVIEQEYGSPRSRHADNDAEHEPGLGHVEAQLRPEYRQRHGRDRREHAEVPEFLRLGDQPPPRQAATKWVARAAGRSLETLERERDPDPFAPDPAGGPSRSRAVDAVQGVDARPLGFLEFGEVAARPRDQRVLGESRQDLGGQALARVLAVAPVRGPPGARARRLAVALACRRSRFRKLCPVARACCSWSLLPPTIPRLARRREPELGQQ